MNTGSENEEAGPSGRGVAYPASMDFSFEDINPVKVRPSQPIPGDTSSKFKKINIPQVLSTSEDTRFETDKDFNKQLKVIKKILYCQDSRDMLQEVKGEDITIFLGNTKCGKSTFINYALGNELTAVLMEEFPCTMSIVKANEQDKGPVISLETVSETTLPSVWSAAKSGLEGKVVDVPGFEDNRGVAQDVANTFYIKDIIRTAKSVKFVLITDINDVIHGDIGNFTCFIDKIHKIFPDISVLYGGIALVFSKDEGNISVDNMCSMLQRKVLKQAQMKVEKSLIKYFVDNKKCISFFKKPAIDGSLCVSDIGKGVIDVIRNEIKGIPRLRLSNVKPAISDKSLCFLLQFHTDFCNGGEYFDLLNKVQECFEDKCKGVSQINSKEEHEEMEKVVNGLEMQFLELFPQYGEDLNFKNLIEKLSSLCYVCGIKKLMDESSIEVQIKFVEFLDQILNIKNGLLYTNQFQVTIKKIKHILEMSRLNLNRYAYTIELLEMEKHMPELAEKRSKEMERDEILLGAQITQRQLDVEMFNRERFKKRSGMMKSERSLLETRAIEKDLEVNNIEERVIETSTLNEKLKTDDAEKTKAEIMRTQTDALKEEQSRRELDDKSKEVLRIKNSLQDLEKRYSNMIEEHNEYMRRMMRQSDVIQAENQTTVRAQLGTFQRLGIRCKGILVATGNLFQGVGKLVDETLGLSDLF